MDKMTIREIIDEFFNHFNKENITIDDVKHIEIIINADAINAIYAFGITIKNNYECITLESLDVNDISIIDLYIVTNDGSLISIPEECMGY